MNRYRVRFTQGRPVHVDIDAESKADARQRVHTSTGRRTNAAWKLPAAKPRVEQPDKRPPCGTYNGYQAHKRRGEDACAECRAASAESHRARRFRIGETTHTGVRLETLRYLLTLDPRVRIALATDLGDAALAAIEAIHRPDERAS